jgi:long-chain acyl-CoA synthetase
MALLKATRTIPELFEFLTEEWHSDKRDILLMKKVDGKFCGITYREAKDEVENFACGLSTLGIKPGDKIAVISENRPEWVYTDIAALSLGAIDVPLYPSLTAESVEFILNNSESKGIIVSNKFQLNKVNKIKNKCRYLKFIIVINDKDTGSDGRTIFSFKEVQERGIIFKTARPYFLKESRSNIKENDLCTIIYTSGVTGEPKGVMLSHKNLLSIVNSILETYPIDENDTFLSFLPLCHIFERMTYYSALASGGMVCYAEGIETIPQNMLEVHPTIITAVPRLFERIYSKILKNINSQSEIKQKIFYNAIEIGKEYCRAKKTGNITFSLSIKNKLADSLVFKKIRRRMGGKLRFFISGGALLARNLAEFFEAIGISIIEGYGLTESSPMISANKPDDYKFGTVGKPFPGVEVKLAPDGEILARGANIMQGYFKNKKETEETLKDGWLHTGDIGVFDSEGYLMITDRKKHLFKTSAGKYIAPTHIENLFLESKYIDQFVLIGDRRMFLSALIVPDFDAIQEYADVNKIPYDKPEELVQAKEIYEMIEKDMSQVQKSLANYERVRKFTLLDKPFSIENGEVTPSLKIRRKAVEERYGSLIEEMYMRN